MNLNAFLSHLPLFQGLPDEEMKALSEIAVDHPVKAGETIFVISNSGRNPEPIEVAMLARQMGLHIIVVTSLTHSKSVGSRHSSGKKLYEFGDVVLDTAAPAGDACLSFKGLDVKAGAVSTVLGAALLNAVMVEAIQHILDKGGHPPVLMSANLDGNEEYNARVMTSYERIVPGVFGMHT